MQRTAAAGRLAPRLYRMTVATQWYDKLAEKERWFEAHFKVARYGSIHTVRRKLAQRGVPFFQRTIQRSHGIWIPKHKIRISFEREEPATKIESKMQIEMRQMEFRGRQREASRMPSRVFGYAKRRRRRGHR